MRSSKDPAVRLQALDEAERALQENRSTVAVLWLSGILDDDGYVAALRDKGYTVEDPQQ